MEFQGLDFDGDRPAQIRNGRKEMAMIHNEISAFGAVEITQSLVPLQDLSEEEKDVYLKQKKEETASIQRGHQRIQEKIKEIRQNFAKAVTAGTRSGSGRIVYEFYDDLITIWGGSTASKPLSFGISSAMLTTQGSSNEGESSSSSTWSQSDYDQNQMSNSQAEDDTPVRLKKRPAVNAIPKLIDNKRRHMEKSLSSAQRYQLLLSEANEDKEIRQDLASSLRESSAIFNAALQNISSSMNNFGTNICKSIEMLAQAMIASNQPQPQRNQMYFQNPNINMQTRSFDNSQMAHQLGENEHQFYEQLQNNGNDTYQSL